jgi:hypothetical protein
LNQSHESEPGVGEEIAQAAEAAEDALPTDPQVRLAAVEERIAALEAVEEDARQRGLAGAEYVSYLKELQDELTMLRRMRVVYGVFGIAIVGVLAFMLLTLVFVGGSPLYTLPAYPAAVLIIALVTGIVVMVLTLAKGVHRSSTDRAKEDTTVSVPSLITELFKQFGPQ